MSTPSLKVLFTENPERAADVIEDLAHNKYYCSVEGCNCEEKCQKIAELILNVKEHDTLNRDANVELIESAKN